MEEGLRLIERESSIENEPRTLNIHQIHLARELARHVMNTKTIQEASAIFTQVSEPVVRRAAKSRFESVRAAINAEEDDDEYNESCIFYNIIRIRDIVSAPF
ncbi:PREDICTED: uncharacterized protein LOC105973166 [Erythranthe guttata]|uniref:uncharacterized protein LOC105973166 n=1 Tax=Erythranthe guttata TaxID=4155 RepID=UPI00064DEAE7|nr:PREDICTED: uncharacterized protein LOC105973166 [Erythranthe guttata]|eukprot:XP_012853641.1 PREDICTED: uncharacterized protein LOC105973166 [Erythranthe guttata]